MMYYIIVSIFCKGFFYFEFYDIISTGGCMSKIKKGRIVRGTVSGIESYGVFVSCDDYYTGLIHISEISHGFVKNITDFVKIGDLIFVEILDVDEELGHLKLSIKDIEYKKNIVVKRKKIKETSLGFKTLEYKLPIWIEESLKKIKK
ncbi:MAG: S1 RNA-binding domain-containing protein [Clostridiales bacterium]|nr:S1 RNA-binding domain-containing protein [Clostridiales bacterium]